MPKRRCVAECFSSLRLTWPSPALRCSVATWGAARRCQRLSFSLCYFRERRGVPVAHVLLTAKQQRTPHPRPRQQHQQRLRYQPRILQRFPQPYRRCWMLSVRPALRVALPSTQHANVLNLSLLLDGRPTHRCCRLASVTPAQQRSVQFLCRKIILWAEKAVPLLRRRLGC